MSLSLNDKRQPSTLISRRRLLQSGGIGALTLGLPGMVAAAVNDVVATGADALPNYRYLGARAAAEACVLTASRGL